MFRGKKIGLTVGRADTLPNTQAGCPGRRRRPAPLRGKSPGAVGDRKPPDRPEVSPRLGIGPLRALGPTAVAFGALWALSTWVG